MLCRTDRGVLLQNDGCMSWGKSLSEAAQTVEALDYYCKVKKCMGQSKACTCGHSATGLCDGSCQTPAPQPVCNGNCTQCASAATCPSRTSAASLAPVPQPAAGVTGLIRPGEGLPKLPPVNAPAAAPVPTPPVPTPPVPTPPAPPAASAPPAKVLAVDVPKADVMAEVVRRAMGK